VCGPLVPIAVGSGTAPLLNIIVRHQYHVDVTIQLFNDIHNQVIRLTAERQEHLQTAH